MPYSARAEQVGPYRILVAYLPWPEWDKNDRLTPNCIARESVDEGGRLYFRERESLWKLSAAARAYREVVRALVQPNLPEIPYYDDGFWSVTLTQCRPKGARADIDHHAGVIDDMVRAGVAKSDTYLRPLTLDSDVVKGEGGLYWYSRQLHV